MHQDFQGTVRRSKVEASVEVTAQQPVELRCRPKVPLELDPDQLLEGTHSIIEVEPEVG